MILGAGIGTIAGGIIQHGSPTMNKSYTILELLITLSIIIILVGMLLSALSKAKDAAQIAECHNYRRQLTIFYYSEGYNENGFSGPRDSSFKNELINLDEWLIQTKCYKCHASSP